jgi:hypothetical protein
MHDKALGESKRAQGHYMDGFELRGGNISDLGGINDSRAAIAGLPVPSFSCMILVQV